MSYTVLLYGATGYSGRLIAVEAARRGMNNSAGLPTFRMVLAGRDSREVTSLARTHSMEARVFGIDERRDAVRGLTDVDVVINAAGPFALTGNALAKGALAAGCHYVDINGEAEVYMKLDDLGFQAAQRKLVMVSGAGHTAAASDLLLYAALQELRSRLGGTGTIELGAIRIAMSRLTSLSRGSLETLARSLREQVRVGRTREVGDKKDRRKETVLWHEPVGRLERSFDFFDPATKDDPPPSRGAGSRNAPPRDLRIASAANLLDTLTARLTADRNRFLAQRIESYVEAGTAARLVYQFGPLLAPLAAMPWARNLARLQLNAFPAGPTRQERQSETHFVVLEIEDPFQGRVLDWGWHTPNPYDFTARVVIEIAQRILSLGPGSCGWLTPSEVLRPTAADFKHPPEYLRGCALSRRSEVLESTS